MDHLTTETLIGPFQMLAIHLAQGPANYRNGKIYSQSVLSIPIPTLSEH